MAAAHREIESKRSEDQNRALRIRTFIDNISRKPVLITKFDERLFGLLVDEMVALPDKKIKVIFKSGLEGLV